MKLTHPCPRGVLTAGFGDYAGHIGADLAAAPWTPIYAAHDGVVRQAWADGEAPAEYRPGGSMVYLTSHSGVYETSYQHMVQRPSVKRGQHVKAGDLIGYVGSTGRSTGPHLHFEMWVGGLAWWGGTAVDPMKYLPKEKPVTKQEMEQLVQMLLDTPVKREGVDASGKPRTGTTTLRKTLAQNEHQIGLTRRIVERIEASISTATDAIVRTLTGSNK